MKGKILLVAVFALVIVGFVYPQIASLRLKKCQAKYGKAFNSERKKLKVPAIAENWNVFKRDDDAVFWGELNSDKVSHKRKTVIFDGCNIVKEEDVYRLPIQNGEKRWINISYRYNKTVNKDSIDYQIGEYSKPISRLKMDSILDAEHMDKGF